MTDSNAPAGWYPTPEGKQRYWDGTAWTNLPWDEAPTDTRAPQSKPPKKRRTTLLVLSIAVVLVVVGIAGALTVRGVSIAAAEQKAEESAQAAAAEEAEVAALAADRQEAADTAERASRLESVTEIETSIKTMAEEHATDGIIDGPVLSVGCSPTSGGSTDDLTALTTVFECFVANQDNGDGTSSGYYYNSTMNWSDGSFTYGLGRS